MAICDTCGTGPVALRMRHWQAIPGTGDQVGVKGTPQTRSVCHDCGSWLAGVLGLLKPPAPSSVYGIPGQGGRRVVFGDQCRLCRMPAGTDAIVVAIDIGTGPTVPRDAVLLCGACAAWFLALTADLRSVRGLVGRSIDGPYGQVLHGMVDSLSVAIEVTEPLARETVEAVCERMGAERVELGDEYVPVDVLFVEFARPADPVNWHRHGGALVAMVPEALRTRLPEVAAAARADWITLPATPQQVAHALLRAWRYPGGLPRDELTGLPIAVDPPAGSPLLGVAVAGGADRQLVAWRLKRYARGYDEVVTTVDGALVIIPRCEPRLAGAVARRLNGLMAGLASVAPAELAPRRGIDVSG